MRFNPRAKLDAGQVRDSGRGSGRSGGIRLPIPTGKAGAGGGIGLVIVIAFFVVSQCLGGGGTSGGGLGSLGLDTNQLQAAGSMDSTRYDDCKTGQDAADNHDCGRVAVVNSIQAFWDAELPRATGTDYVTATTVTFTGSVGTGCGQATSDVGPFYCPARGDMSVYLDPTFFDEVLEGQLRGPDGAFVEWYVLGHEYGHHIQNITGQMGRVRTQQGPNSDAVKLELQADCYAGLWTRAAVTTEDASGEPLFSEGPSQADIKLAIAAAEAVGDDHIQKVSQGRVDESQWTHGSSAQRIQWFRTGYDGGTYADCDIWR